MIKQTAIRASAKRFIVASAATILVASGTVAVAAGPVVSLERVSIATDGSQGNSDAVHATISTNARFVAFDSDANNLDPALRAQVSPSATASSGGPPYYVYVRDRVAATTELISVGLNGAVANAASGDPAISGDGRFVAFDSFASNLVSDDTNGITDVFVRDRLLGTTVRASVNDGGTALLGGGEPTFDDDVPSWISDDGRYVVFRSYAKLTPNDTNDHLHIFRRDLVANTTALIDVNPAGASADGDADAAAISGDGRYVLFDSSADDIVAGASPFQSEVLYLRDMVAGTSISITPNVSTPGYCAGSSGALGTFNLSRNARFAIFNSTCWDIAAGQSQNDNWFLRDLNASVTIPFRLNQNNTPTDRAAFASISDSGRYAVQWSQAAGVVPGATSVNGDVYLHDFLAAQTYRISQRVDNGVDGNAGSYRPFIGAGGHIVFISSASNLIDGDTNLFDDVYVATLDALFSSGFD